jgi:hypothetical protein
VKEFVPDLFIFGNFQFKMCFPAKIIFLPKKKKNERGKMGKELQVLSDNNSLNITYFQ